VKALAGFGAGAQVLATQAGAGIVAGAGLYFYFAAGSYNAGLAVQYGGVTCIANEHYGFGFLLSHY
jgi:hypothetical protein